MKLLSDDLIPVGKVIKPSGIRGWLKVKYFSNNLENLLSLKTLYIESDKGFYPYKKEGVKKLKGYFAVKFKEVDNFDDAEKLRNCLIYAAKESFIPLNEGEFYLADLIGLDVFDLQDKYIGKVFSFIEINSDRSLIVVKKEEREVLIPLTEGFIKDVNLAEKFVLVELPEGFI